MVLFCLLSTPSLPEFPLPYWLYFKISHLVFEYATTLGSEQTPEKLSKPENGVLVISSVLEEVGITHLSLMLDPNCCFVDIADIATMDENCCCVWTTVFFNLLWDSYSTKSSRLLVRRRNTGVTPQLNRGKESLALKGPACFPFSNFCSKLIFQFCFLEDI